MTDVEVGQVWHEWADLSMDDDGRMMRVTAVDTEGVDLECVFLAGGYRVPGQRSKTRMSIKRLLRNWELRPA